MSVGANSLLVGASLMHSRFYPWATLYDPAKTRDGALAPDGQGGALAIVAGGSLLRRTPDGVWTTIASAEFDLSCCGAVGAVIYSRDGVTWDVERAGLQAAYCDQNTSDGRQHFDKKFGWCRGAPVTVC
jgi:hypothetical protein